MDVGDVMTAEVVAVREHDPVRTAAAALVAQRWSSAPVVDDDGLVVGVVSDADLLRVVATPARGFSSSHRWEVGDLMVPARTVRPSDHLGLAVALLIDQDARCLPVLDSDDELVGVVHRYDLLAVVGGHDPLARRGVLAALAQLSPAAPRPPWDVEVADGVALLRQRPGAQVSRAESDLAGVLARTVPGVVGVVLVPPGENVPASPDGETPR